MPETWPHPNGDPRLRFPALAAIPGFFTEKKLIRWAYDRKCLCGCNRQTKALRGRAKQGHSYFTNKCWPRLSVKYNLREVINYPAIRDPKWLESVQRENEDRYCTVDDTKWYVGMITADVHDREITIAAWCREKGLSQETVYQWIRAMRYDMRITKRNAARILMALGEQVPEDLARRYQGHVRHVKKARKKKEKAQERLALAS